MRHSIICEVKMRFDRYYKQSPVCVFSCAFAQNEEVQENDDSGTSAVTYCREKNRLVSTEKDDMFKLVEAFVGEEIILQCHFCNENDDHSPKNWYKLDPYNDAKETEVQLGMENNMTLNRLHVTIDHGLVFHNVVEEDSGEYFCKGLDEEDEKYNFFLDIIVKSELSPEKGNMTAWKLYHDEQFEPINNVLRTGGGIDQQFLSRLKVSLLVVTEWESPGPCELCGRPKGDGRKITKGPCRLKVSSESEAKVVAKNQIEKTLLRATHLSCRSLTLRKLVPDIINRTLNIPDFWIVEKCDGVCNPDAEGIYKGFKSTKKTGFKYRKTFVLAENAHLTLICPESTLENKVEWKINGRTIKPGVAVEPPSQNVEPRVRVDTLNTLYLYGVTKEEEGNYTCYVDEVRMQQVRVFVVSKSKILTQAFVRHMMYLGFILSLTLTCYCAGLVVTWTRRHGFKSYADLLKEKENLDTEPLLNKEDFEDVEKEPAKTEKSSSPYDTPHQSTPKTRSRKYLESNEIQGRKGKTKSGTTAEKATATTETTATSTVLLSAASFYETDPKQSVFGTTTTTSKSSNIDAKPKTSLRDDDNFMVVHEAKDFRTITPSAQSRAWTKFDDEDVYMMNVSTNSSEPAQENFKDYNRSTLKSTMKWLKNNKTFENMWKKPLRAEHGDSTELELLAKFENLDYQSTSSEYSLET